ncbi:nickel pincer cofactor biosynthesis protein LarB [Puniceicoccaceae bacterium K14]|nr:nickel pincer cofactor biosynthesis protein LarB [Puniceicoccaceae bacterium K14]
MKEEINLDFDRDKRIGQPEIIYGESKSVEQLLEIALQLSEAGRNGLYTRVSEEKAAVVCNQFSDIEYNSVAKCLSQKSAPPFGERGEIALVCGGTSDIPILREAECTADFLGFDTKVYADVGVAGLDRLLKCLPDIRKAKVVIVFAGFEGALASVLAGQISVPIIGVPTSVGYGVAAGGMAALNAMLTSCSNGLLVTNIDNGCGAVMAAARICPLMTK